MHVVHVADCINREFGGQAIAVVQAADAVVETGLASSEILAFDLPHLGPPLATAPGVRVRLFAPRRPHLFGWHPGYRRALTEALAGPATIAHAHALWRLPLLWASRLAAERRLPLVVSPHGGLQPQAVGHHRLRKLVAWPPTRRALARASVICATSDNEADHLRRLWSDVPIVVAPLAVDIPPLPEGAAEAGGRNVLFLSRLHPIKGLFDLLEAWSVLRPAGWTLTVAGPDEGGLLAEARRIVSRGGCAPTVEFRGAADAAAKRELFHRAELLVLPTRSENFGLVIAEALASGVPVITTRGAPWRELQTHRCGWWIDSGVQPLVRALREALALDPAERLAMGRRGRALVAREYGRERLGQRLAEAYRLAAGRTTEQG